MQPFPLNLTQLLGQYGAYPIYLLIGFAFGYVLEISGFGNSKKLAAQFYFKELTVLKVMFTGIIVAMLGIFFTAALGLLDYNLVWVNPTYLWPGIVGGFIMGIGFIIGGFCPGTSIVSAVTGKIDGIFFVLGVFFGIFVFGETVEYFYDFFFSSYYGRVSLMDFFGWDTGWVVLAVTLMALFMFWGSEQLEKIVGGMDLSKAPKQRYTAAGVIVLLAATILLIGQPTNYEKWQMMAEVQQPLLDERAYQIHPGELLSLMNNDGLILHILDVRAQTDYNIFHIQHAEHTPIDSLMALIPDYLLEPSNAVFVVVGNDEALATEAWKMLKAENLHNVYMLEGGINYWLDIFASEDPHAVELVMLPGDDALRHAFSTAMGDRHPAANPNPHDFELEYVPKVKLEIKRGPGGGGCG